jgi:hypothetical protein
MAGFSGRSVVIAGLVVIAGCASRGTETRASTTELTQQEIVASRASDLYSAVQQLRPRWLQVRSPRSINSDTGIFVFQGRSLIGGPETLKQFDTRSVLRLRYLDSAQADAQLTVPAGQHVQGAIVIELVAGGGG